MHIIIEGGAKVTWYDIEFIYGKKSEDRNFQVNCEWNK